MKKILQQDLFRYIGNGNQKFINRLRYIYIIYSGISIHLLLSSRQFISQSNIKIYLENITSQVYVSHRYSDSGVNGNRAGL